MEKHKHFGQKTLNGIMLVVILFFIADLLVFALMYFNIDLAKEFNKFTDNTSINNMVKVTDNNTDNTITPTLKITKVTDNS